MRWAVAAAAAVVALAGAGSAAAERSAAGALPGSEPYGLLASNANFVPGRTLAERTAHYRALYDAGVRAIRLDIGWVQVEPPGRPKGTYDFTERDREVQAITDAGLKVIGILDYSHPAYSRLGAVVQSTPLAGGLPPFGVGYAGFFPPDNPEDFAHYARATAAHFGDRVIAWEVWNEENEGWRFWPPHEDPAAYGRLLCSADRALRQVTPATPVLFGGLFFPAVADLPGMSAVDFLDAAYRANPRLGACYDALAYHPYPYPFTAPELDVPIRGSVLSAADQLRVVLRNHGDAAKPLWITEVGWPTHDLTYGVNETKQAQYVARMALATFAQRIPVLTFYTYGDDADPTGGVNQEAWFGFFRVDGTPKPSYRALSTFAQVFAGARFVADRSRALGLPPGRLLLGGRGFALRYRSPTAAITAVWLANESAVEAQGHLPDGGTFGPRALRVRVPVRAKRVEVVDYLGTEREVRARHHAIVVEAGPGPQYVVDPRDRGSTL